METISITLRYGLTKSMTIDVNEGSSLRSILANANNRAVLGYPENVSAVIDGQTISIDELVNDGDVIQLEKQAAAKA